MAAPRPKKPTRKAPARTQGARRTSIRADQYRVQPVERAIDLLLTFSRREPRLGLVDLAARTGLPKPTVLRLGAALMRKGILARDERTGLFSLGNAILAIGAAYEVDLRERSRQVLRKYSDELGETFIVSVRSGYQRIHIEFLEGSQPFRRIAKVGDSVPLNVGAASRILLAAMSDEELAAYLASPAARSAPNGGMPLSPSALKADVLKVRRTNIAETVNEREMSGAAVAAPIRDASGHVVAAVHVSLPAPRFTSEVRTRCVKSVTAAALEISAAIGYRPDPD